MAQPAMPKNIVRFERLGYATVLLGTGASMVADWPTVGPSFAQAPLLHGLTVAFIVALQGAWVWLIARKQQNWARWVSLFIAVTTPLASLLNFYSRFRINPELELVHAAIYLAWFTQLYFIFTGDARPWFASESVGPAGEPLSPNEA